jgi:hypothetical protein
MRTIEMLGANKKIITTNTDIKHYDFYHPNNICIVDRDKVLVPTKFMETPYVPVEDQVKDRYSVNYFILDILGLTQKNGHDFYVEHSGGGKQ